VSAPPSRASVALALLLMLVGSWARTAPASAADTLPLDRYLNGLKSLRVSFSQAVTDAQGHSVSHATGSLLVLRPGKFRWEIHTQGESGAGQLLVADGHNLWFFDRDLDQVTVRPMGTALSATPAMLLSGAADVRQAFEISAAPASAGLDWVRVVPRSAEADFREALLGFSGDEIKRMILKDKLGQTATLLFERSERNAPVSAAEVTFTPPPGVDVIGTPEK